MNSNEDQQELTILGIASLRFDLNMKNKVLSSKVEEAWAKPRLWRSLDANEAGSTTLKGPENSSEEGEDAKQRTKSQQRFIPEFWDRERTANLQLGIVLSDLKRKMEIYE